MKSDYKTLGQFIRPLSVKNKDLAISLLLGVSITKKFIISIANTVGTDFSNYKVVKQNQFAYGPVTSRNGEKISVALLEEPECIISSSYTVFEVIDQSILLPQYLMMWFTRPEFDRYARYKSHGSVREMFSWEDMCNVELPVPDIEKQQAIVKAYQVVTDRIALKEKINGKLEEMVNAMFKDLFIDDSDDLPVGWKYIPMEELCHIITKGTTPDFFVQESNDSINYIKGESIRDDRSLSKNLISHIDISTHESFKRSQIQENDILFSIAGTLGKFAFVDRAIVPANCNQAISIIRADKQKIDPFVLFSYFLGGWHEEVCKKNVQQAVQANLTLGTLKELPILFPDLSTIEKYSFKVVPLVKKILFNFNEQENLRSLQTLLLSRLSTE